jgi:hypothetical protein
MFLITLYSWFLVIALLPPHVAHTGKIHYWKLFSGKILHYRKISSCMGGIMIIFKGGEEQLPVFFEEAKLD